jgi:hypothetical protein
MFSIELGMLETFNEGGRIVGENEAMRRANRVCWSGADRST